MLFVLFDVLNCRYRLNSKGMKPDEIQTLLELRDEIELMMSRLMREWNSDLFIRLSSRSPKDGHKCYIVSSEKERKTELNRLRNEYEMCLQKLVEQNGWNADDPNTQVLFFWFSFFCFGFVVLYISKSTFLIIFQKLKT